VLQVRDLEGALQEGSEARDKAWRAHERDLETLRGELAEAKAEAAALAADKASLLRQVRAQHRAHIVVL
jgi:ribosomal protein L29